MAYLVKKDSQSSLMMNRNHNPITEKLWIGDKIH